ncbi:Sphingosine kinase 2 [Perkinsus chesapeaki]|uniref:Sphingosine kinase 2 n=1 Tax=Perkinsus chesapeaki TaxID=330153 RepID=A0A7J6MFK2_PERCH|nr:Sphingosine kinase 2 [Perkinsus chesapeaki]
MELLSSFFDSHFRYRSAPRRAGDILDDALVSFEDDTIVIREASTRQIRDALAYKDVVAVNYGDSSLQALLYRKGAFIQITVLEMKNKSCTSSAGRQRRDIVLERLDSEDTNNCNGRASVDLVAAALLHTALGDLDTMVDSGSECPTKTRVLVIINPISGKGKAMDMYTSIAKPLFELCQDRFMIEEVVTESAEHTKQVAMESADKFDTFVFCGGDGLVHDFLQGIFKLPDYRAVLNNITLGFLLAGSGNGLACSCAFASEGEFDLNPKSYVGDFQVALRLILRGRTSALDAAQIDVRDTSTGEQQKASVLACLSASWGLFSDVDLGSDHLRFLGGARFTLYALWRIINIRKYSGRISYIEASDELNNKPLKALPDTSNPLWKTQQGDFAGVLVVNVSHSAADLMAAPERKLDDGQ